MEYAAEPALSEPEQKRGGVERGSPVKLRLAGDPSLRLKNGFA